MVISFFKNVLQKLQVYEPSEDIKKTIEHAYLIALKTLHARYTKNGIHAGKNQFSDIWLRDSCYASFGSLSAGDIHIVKSNLVTIIKNTKSDGQVPLRIGQKSMVLKFLGFKGISRPIYIEDKGVSIPSDSNSLFLITVHEYVKVSENLDFITRNYDLLKKVTDWNFTLDEDDDLLIEEGYYANWADSVRKRGKVLYTNVLHYEAIRVFAELCKMIDKKEEYTHYYKISEAIKKRINDLFWHDTFYIDWIHRHKHMYFATDGNVLAILFGVANKEKAHKIQHTIRDLDLDNEFSTKTNFPKYHFRHIFPLFFPIRIHDYHNGLEWLWIGCVDAVSKHKIDMNTQATELLYRIAKKIIEHNGVYEVYFDGQPVKRMFYSSEQGFAWSSGMFVWACHKLGLASSYD